MDNIDYCKTNEKLDEDINIDFKKIFFALLNRKEVIVKVFAGVLIFFIIMSIILPKKWQVDADLYINKSNNSNMAEINPYFIEEIGIGGGMTAMLSGNSGNLLNEIELMQSPLVIDKVIKENDIRFKKILGIIQTKKTGEYLTAEKFIKNGPKIEVKKGTNVVSISYKSKDKDFAYNVITSLIVNYVSLRKELMSEKSKFDKAILEEEYNKVKTNLDKKIKEAEGLPATAITGTGNLTALSAFSESARKAISSIQGEYIAGEKSQIEVQEETEKLTQLASKLQWAKLVEEMSDSSKVVLLKEPHPLRDWEYKSPKLFTNIILGIIFGAISALIVGFILELTDKKLTYLMISGNIIYNIRRNFKKLKAIIWKNSGKKLGFIFFENISKDYEEKLEEFKDAKILKADITKDFAEELKDINAVILFVEINKTNAEDYKLIKEIILSSEKEVCAEVLL